MSEKMKSTGGVVDFGPRWFGLEFVFLGGERESDAVGGGFPADGEGQISRVVRDGKGFLRWGALAVCARAASSIRDAAALLLPGFVCAAVPSVGIIPCVHCSLAFH